MPPALKYLLIILWSFALVSASVLAFTHDLVKMTNGSDKTLHVMMCSLIMMGPVFLFKRKLFIIIPAIIMLCAGFGIEIIQSFMPDRNPEPGDMIANIIGVSLGIIIGKLLKTGFFSGLSKA